MEPKPTYDEMKRSELERAFETYWRMLAPLDMQDYEREYEFLAPERKWRFDCAWPDETVAVELDGGTWSGGRHTRGTGYRNDCEKLNAATGLGWAVFRFTTDMLRDDPEACIGLVAAKIEQRLS